MVAFATEACNVALATGVDALFAAVRYKAAPAFVGVSCKPVPVA